MCLMQAVHLTGLTNIYCTYAVNQYKCFREKCCNSPLHDIFHQEQHDVDAFNLS